ncbi:MAG: 1,4-dihydroxy-2-naphthoate polyprenyltransferase [Acidimicrobiia bacterium]
METIKNFYHGARPKTLSAAIAPVLIAVGMAYSQHENHKISMPLIAACFVVSIFFQIGVNYANDYSDGIKGTDENRVGPMRLVGSGKASPRSVFIATNICFLIACIAGLYISFQTTFWLIAIGLVCVLLAWFYTGGKHPYGYYGFGELSAFLTFGLLATTGSFYVLTEKITFESVIAGLIPGMFSIAILLANNIRDIKTDIESNKKTLPVRLGKKYSQYFYALVILLVALWIVILGITFHYVLFALAASPLLYVLAKKIFGANNPKDYIYILVNTSKLNLFFSVIIFGLLMLDI